MLRPFRTRFALAAILVLAAGSFIAAQQSKWARDPKQPVDEDYTKKIREYTTAPYFLSPLVDYLPASKTVPTPKAVHRRRRRRARASCPTRPRCTTTCGCSRRRAPA